MADKAATEFLMLQKRSARKQRRLKTILDNTSPPSDDENTNQLSEQAVLYISLSEGGDTICVMTNVSGKEFVRCGTVFSGDCH